MASHSSLATLNGGASPSRRGEIHIHSKDMMEGTDKWKDQRIILDTEVAFFENQNEEQLRGKQFFMFSSLGIHDLTRAEK